MPKEKRDEKLEMEVYALYLACKSMGYGHAMEIISALWRYDFRNRGIMTEICFVPTPKSSIKEDWQKTTNDACKVYDDIIEQVFEGLESEE